MLINDIRDGMLIRVEAKLSEEGDYTFLYAFYVNNYSEYLKTLIFIKDNELQCELPDFKNIEHYELEQGAEMFIDDIWINLGSEIMTPCCTIMATVI